MKAPQSRNQWNYSECYHLRVWNEELRTFMSAGDVCLWDRKRFWRSWQMAVRRLALQSPFAGSTLC